MMTCRWSHAIEKEFTDALGARPHLCNLWEPGNWSKFKQKPPRQVRENSRLRRRSQEQRIAGGMRTTCSGVAGVMASINGVQRSMAMGNEA